MNSNERRRILILTSMESEYDRAVLARVARYARHRGGWDLHVYPNTYPSAAVLRDTQPHGIIMRSRADAVLTRWRRRHKVPLVDLGWPTDPPPANVVAPDNEAIGRMAADHLIGLGFRRLVGIGDHIVATAVRIRSFTKEGEGRGCTVESYAFQPVSTKSWTMTLRVNELRQWLARLTPPLGIFVMSDYLGERLYAACRQLGWRIPEDVVVIGAGNDELRCELVNPPLSSIALDVDRIGYEAAQRLDAMIEGKGTPTEPYLAPPLHVVQRASSDMMAIEDAPVAEALRFIRANAARGIRVGDVVERSELSRRTLERRFKQWVGRLPAQEIRRLRIQFAQQLLIGSEDKIAAVAKACGFGRLQEFWSVFRNETGVSPREFRRQHRTPMGTDNRPHRLSEA